MCVLHFCEAISPIAYVSRSIVIWYVIWCHNPAGHTFSSEPYLDKPGRTTRDTRLVARTVARFLSRFYYSRAAQLQRLQQT
jgi:hypothetical protein